MRSKWISVAVASLCLCSTGGPLQAERPMLVGRIDQDRLFKEYPIYAENNRQYVPDEKYIKELRAIDRKIEILVFLGTWCPHSMTGVPMFLKVYETTDNPALSITLYGVDQDIRDREGHSERNRVERVPTFIFLRDGSEIGRIVEFPRKSMEEDFWMIVSGA
jgi:thiol-disulfide isomerase/thioredoxin